MKINAVFLLIIIRILSSCRDDIKIDPYNPLRGTWNFSWNHDETSIYTTLDAS
jgi:hypothetical protein